VSEIKKLWSKADSVRDCLAHQRTERGRRRYTIDEDPLLVKNLFLSDEAKLLSSKAWRALARKTQVFTHPHTPLIRSRQAHVLEVIAVTVIAAEMLGLNTDLARAAAVGHDIGHTPFGHQGEAWMQKALGKPEFCHEIMGAVVAQHVERRGKGLNLCRETLQGMVYHSGDRTPPPDLTPEVRVLRYTDKFTYIFHDINDIIGRMKYPARSELQRLADTFGRDQRERTSTAIAGLIVESNELGYVSFEQSELAQEFRKLRSLMYEIYPRVTRQRIEPIMDHVLEFLTQLDIGDPYMLACLLTDDDAMLIADSPMADMQVWNRTALCEIAKYLEEIGKVNLCDPDLSW
jgi:dGTPase